MSTDAADDYQLGNGRVGKTEMLRAHLDLTLRELILVVFERDEQWRGQGVQRQWRGPRHLRLRRYYILNDCRRVGMAQLVEQFLFGDGIVALRLPANDNPVANGRVDGARPLTVLDASLALREHARHGRHEEAHVARRQPRAPYDVVAAPPGADDAAPGRRQVVVGHAPQHAEGQHAVAEREHVRPNQEVDERRLERARRQVVLRVLVEESWLQRGKRLVSITSSALLTVRHVTRRCRHSWHITFYVAFVVKVWILNWACPIRVNTLLFTGRCCAA